MEALTSLWLNATGHKAVTCESIAGGGGERRYCRLTSSDGHTAIGAICHDPREQATFVYLARHFAGKGLPVPRIIADDPEAQRYLQTDLGSRSLYDAVSHGREAGGDYSPDERTLLRRAMQALPFVQVRGAEGLDFSRCLPPEAMDRTAVFFDLNYFKYCFLRTSGIAYDELKLEEDFRLLADDLTALPQHYFMYRDFQARNVMLDGEGHPWFIDFQGGRRGPLHYDVASFLWQASARYPDELREELLTAYLHSLSGLISVNEQEFRQGLRLCLLFRLLQVLGAYGFRGRYERKPYFLNSIPPALANLGALLRRYTPPYPYLRGLLAKLAGEETPIKTPPPTARRASLTVRVMSFSYKRGLPQDETGNGGGYVFDCRAVHNPGKHERFKEMTGLDEPVRRFLEEDGEMPRFLHHIRPLAEAHVARYVERGFSNLMLCFGCTGGRHRSVYAAQSLARHISARFGVNVQLTHRELGLSAELPLPARNSAAMVLAAGLGTRLRPLTDTRPKALVEAGGKTLIDIATEKLRESGYDKIVVNAHHFAPMMRQWCKGKDYICLSDESRELLDTGGAIKHALPLLGSAQTLLVHNVDILSNADLQALLLADPFADATLLVSARQTRRMLLFDASMRLVGWTDTATGEVKSPHPKLDVSSCRMLAFAGIHLLRRTLLDEMALCPSKFSIIDFYISHCLSHTIRGHLQASLRLLDAGKPEALASAPAFLASL